MVLKKWKSLGVEYKLHILIQGSLIILFVLTHQWMADKFEAQLFASGQARATEIADGLINGMNMLMLTGTISNPDNRLLLLKKMGQSKGIQELRIIRAQQVVDQFGPGLPEEQAVDELDQQAISGGKPLFRELLEDDGTALIRVVVPFIAQKNFRGTNCLSCHHVQDGSVNGAASVTVDLSKEQASISAFKKWLGAGYLAFQVLLSVIIAIFVRRLVTVNIGYPVKKLQATMFEIGNNKEYSKRAEIDVHNADIGNMAQSFNLLVENLTLFAKVFEHSGEAIAITDANNNIVSVNKAFTIVTGYTPEEAIGKNPCIMNSGMHDAIFYQRMWQKIHEDGVWKGEIFNRRKNGEIYPEWLSISTIRDGNGKIVNHVSLFTDITSQKESEKHIQFLAHYDPLTRLPNRRLFGDRLKQVLSSANRHTDKAGLLFIDLDRFKNVNDSLGHLAGDELLRTAADRLDNCIRESDTVARLGGDEFVVILNEIKEPEDAAHVSQKILDALSDPFELDGHKISISSSIGISIYPDDGADSDTLIKNADTAMYHAKASGRNNFQFFTPGMNAKAFETLLMENELREAINKNEFMLYYQPKVSVASGKVVGMEALIRWKHAARGLVPPVQFIAVAEECGLIIEIGKWALREACAQNKKWQELGLLHAPVAVNISALQFHAGDLKSQVLQTLHDTGLAAHYLELEITEGIIMKETESTIATLASLKEIGVLLSIDDFGTGYSSLSYLNRFPVDTLKIDKSFINGITSNTGSAAITRTIITMGDAFGLTVIAEGVETAEQYAFLKRNGCDEIQGYYFSKPLPADEFTQYIALQGMIPA